jgi:hypothetical protein
VLPLMTACYFPSVNLLMRGIVISFAVFCLGWVIDFYECHGNIDSSKIVEGSLSFGRSPGVANSCQYWSKWRGYAGKSHWEQDFEAVDSRDTGVLSGLSPRHELSRIVPPGRAGA